MLALKVFDTGAEMSCCGMPMQELVPDTVDAALEKHVPDVSIDGNKVSVNIGSVDHPMLEEHYIHFICLVKNTGYEIHTLEPGEKPHTDFYISDEEKPVAVFEYCNLHGLWKLDM